MVAATMPTSQVFSLATEPSARFEKLDVERGAGRYVDRPSFAPYYDALQKQARHAEPVAVKR